jgi:hypothetical protein
MLNYVVPFWVVGVLACLLWLVQWRLKRHIRIRALLCLPATVLHELAHGLVGLVLGAAPSTVNLWPKRVSQTAWRLGYVGFRRLNFWNAGAIALAPLLWLVALISLAHLWQPLMRPLAVKNSLLLAASLVWIALAVTPSKSDWVLAVKNPLSAGLFLLLWAAGLYWLLAFRLVL